MTSDDGYEAKLAAFRKTRNRKVLSTLTVVDTKKGIIEHGTLNKNATALSGRRESIPIPDDVRKKLFE